MTSSSMPGKILEDGMNKLELAKLHKKVPTKDPPREEPKIFLHALLITTTPCSLKMVGYIKHLNVIIF